MPTWAEIWVVRFLGRKHLPIWLVILIDLLLVTTAYFLSQLLITNFDFDKLVSYNSLQEFLLLNSAYLVAFVVCRSYIGVFRHTGVRDLIRLGYSAMLGGFLVFTVSRLAKALGWFDTNTLTLSLIVLQSVSFLLAVTGVRLFVKLVYVRYFLNPRTKNNQGVIIYGAGATGVTVRNAIKNDRTANREVVAFIDDNPKLQGKSIDGIKVYSMEDAFEADFLESNKVVEVIWSIQLLQGGSFYRVGDACIANNLEFHRVPNIKDWIGGSLSSKQIKRVKIEDLLNRTVISLDNNKLHAFIKDKVVLVTGAAGSIGSEICRQVLYYQPKYLVLFDNAETPMNDLLLELRGLPEFAGNVVSVMGDVTRENRVDEVFSQFKPNMVFHAAAYKHVPMMEVNPKEAVKVNVEGTRIVASKAIEHRTEKFVLISTDKAVNPTNVMGATKRAAEILIHNLAKTGNTEFITTRFGNVLGSNGSVIPLFHKQIENRQPLTVTHKDVIRYFMTIPEACQLVFEAATMGNGGEIFVFDMGEPVRIYDLAEKMVRLSGLVLGQDISIVETGLRPGEKLYEELLSDAESTLPTHHPKIMIAQVATPEEHTSMPLFVSLTYAVNNGTTDMEIVTTLKSLIPEYISQNSDFAALDNKAN
jgi:FlaA1/EpsC-like NDP-sugar epimerase